MYRIEAMVTVRWFAAMPFGIDVKADEAHPLSCRPCCVEPSWTCDSFMFVVAQLAGGADDCQDIVWTEKGVAGSRSDINVFRNINHQWRNVSLVPAFERCWTICAIHGGSLV